MKIRITKTIPWFFFFWFLCAKKVWPKAWPFTQSHEPEAQQPPKSLPLGFNLTSSQSPHPVERTCDQPWNVLTAFLQPLTVPPGLVVSVPAAQPVLHPSSHSYKSGLQKQIQSALSPSGAPHYLNWQNKNPDSLACHPKTCRIELPLPFFWAQHHAHPCDTPGSLLCD